ncbi:hypothetical protein AaE_013149 [Aphanomyces astaci]|uniref:Uncharacterized protein n=2 Tax=Aphanomyces astaci TaxID=112090 RepID=A0A6A4ZDM0_APHAT|nr:hypothetical protein AaE_013149 [Aphanomyces astaci]
MDPAVLAKRPKVRTCYVCGRDYGFSSFEIHLKQCKQMWIAQEELKPLRERRPVPEPPPTLLVATEGGGDAPSSYDLTPEQLEAQNRAAQQAFENKARAKLWRSVHTVGERSTPRGLRSTIEAVLRSILRKQLVKPDSVMLSIRYLCVGSTADNNTIFSHALPAKAKVPQTPHESNHMVNNVHLTQEPQLKVSTPPEDKSRSADKQPSLAGSLGANRKQRAALQSPLTSSSPTGQDELSPSSNRSIQTLKAKLDHWEKTALAMVQDIRDMKAAIDQM